MLDCRALGDATVVLQYVVESLLGALLHLVDAHSDEGRSQLPAYRVSSASIASSSLHAHLRVVIYLVENPLTLAPPAPPP